MTISLASFVTAITPNAPIATEHADVIRGKVSDTLHQLAAEVEDYLQGLPVAEGDALLPKEEQVIIITSPPPP